MNVLHPLNADLSSLPKSSAQESSHITHGSFIQASRSRRSAVKSCQTRLLMQTRFHSAAHASFRIRFKFNLWARAIKRLSIKRLRSRRAILAEQSVYAFMMRAVCNDRAICMYNPRRCDSRDANRRQSRCGRSIEFLSWMPKTTYIKDHKGSLSSSITW